MHGNTKKDKIRHSAVMYIAPCSAVTYGFGRGGYLLRGRSIKYQIKKLEDSNKACSPNTINSQSVNMEFWHP